MTRLRPLAAAWMLGATVVALGAQQTLDPRKVPGVWKPYPAREGAARPGQPAWLTQAHLDGMRAAMAQVVDVFRKVPVLASPIGFCVFPHREIFFQRSSAHPLETDRRWALPSHLWLVGTFFQDDGRTVYENADAFILNVDANNLDVIFKGARDFGMDSEATMYLEPAMPDRKIGGFPAFDHGVVITHRTQPFFVPVSQERVLRLRIAEADAGVVNAKEYAKLAQFSPAMTAEIRQEAAGVVAVAEARAKALRDQLAALDLKGRQAPAYTLESPDPDHPLSAAGTPDARAVVQPNPDFFDQARPGDIQMLTLFRDCVTSPCDHGLPIVDKIQEQLDWKALAAIVR